ncbi:MAG: mannose-1-phosphate guanylyltransferase [Mycobacteriales bacterium]
MSESTSPERAFYAVIPAGGSGTRLWPLSRSAAPKFFHDLAGAGTTLLQDTVSRLGPVAGPGSTYVVTGAAHAAEVARQLAELPAGQILVEPAPRDSAPAIGLAATLIARRDPDAVMGSFAADHLVRDERAFVAAVHAAAAAAAEGYLVTIGLTPTEPETGYGYIKPGGALSTGGAVLAEEFKEKPDLATARSYVRAGYLWNASMFIWRVDVFCEELHRQLPDLAAGLDRIADAWDGPDRDAVLAEVWASLPKTNVDQGVMEDAARRGRVATVPASIGWDDIGDWDTLAGVLPARDGVATIGSGPVLAIDSTDSLVVAAGDRLVAAVGIKDVVVVDTPDAVLVCARDHAQSVKALVDRLKADDRADLT